MSNSPVPKPSAGGTGPAAAKGSTGPLAGQPGAGGMTRAGGTRRGMWDLGAGDAEMVLAEARKALFVMVLLGAVMALCFAYQFSVLLPQAGIGWQAHIGGLAGGIAAGWFFRDRRPGPRP